MIFIYYSLCNTFETFSFSSPDLTETIESTESSQVLTDTAIHTTSRMSEVMVVPQDDGNGCYIQPTHVSIQPTQNINGHFVNMQPQYANTNIYHNVQDGSCISMPGVELLF